MSDETPQAPLMPLENEIGGIALLRNAVVQAAADNPKLPSIQLLARQTCDQLDAAYLFACQLGMHIHQLQSAAAQAVAEVVGGKTLSAKGPDGKTVSAPVPTGE